MRSAKNQLSQHPALDLAIRKFNEWILGQQCKGLSPWTSNFSSVTADEQRMNVNGHTDHTENTSAQWTVPNFQMDGTMDLPRNNLNEPFSPSLQLVIPTSHCPTPPTQPERARLTHFPSTSTHTGPTGCHTLHVASPATISSSVSTTTTSSAPSSIPKMEHTTRPTETINNLLVSPDRKVLSNNNKVFAVQTPSTVSHSQHHQYLQVDPRWPVLGAQLQTSMPNAMGQVNRNTSIGTSQAQCVTNTPIQINPMVQSAPIHTTPIQTTPLQRFQGQPTPIVLNQAIPPPNTVIYDQGPGIVPAPHAVITNSLLPQDSLSTQSAASPRSDLPLAAQRHGNAFGNGTGNTSLSSTISPSISASASASTSTSASSNESDDLYGLLIGLLWQRHLEGGPI